MKTIAIIQSRLRSQRLPGKSIRPVAGATILSIIFERLRMSKGIDVIYVATGPKKYNQEIEKHLLENIKIFYGDEDDVLSRFVKIIEIEHADYVLRINGDNPFFDYTRATEYITLAAQHHYDYCSSLGLPLGVRVELVRAGLLLDLHKKNLLDKHHEHITLYVREHINKYRVYLEKNDLNLKYPDVRLTIDESQDFLMLDELLKRFPKAKNLSVGKLITLVSLHPEIMNINKAVIQKSEII